MSDDDEKDVALKRLSSLYRDRKSLPRTGADNQDRDAVLPHMGRGKELETTEVVGADLPTDLCKWPPLPRYLVAGLERRGAKRPVAVDVVREAWSEAGGGA